MLIAQLLAGVIQPSQFPAATVAKRPRAYSLLIESHPDMRRTAFLIRVQRGPHTTRLVYARRDSIRRYFDPVEDSLRRELFDNLPIDKQARQNLIEAFGRRAKENHQRYAAYTKDSIDLKNASPANRSYFSLLDTVYVAGDNQFQDAGSSRRRGDLHITVLHATSYYLYRQAAGQSARKAYMTAPDMNTNPLFVRLLTHTLELYRRSHPDSFMDKRYTRDY